MTRDDIIRMAQECQLIGIRPHLDGIYEEALERFAALVAAHAKTDQINLAYQQGYEAGSAVEREACAEIAEKQRFAMHISLTSHPPQNGTAVGIATEIRARGKS